MFDAYVYYFKNQFVVMSSYETYGQRYEKAKEKRTNNSKSVSKIASNHQQSQMGQVVSKISERVDGLEIKIVSMTNIIKLLQKYTETKDQQFEKEKENQEFRKSPDFTFEARELQAKIKEFQLLNQRMKSQINAVQSLRIGFSRENLKRSPRSIDTNQSPINQKVMLGQIEATMFQLQSNLREQLNKKIEICMNCFKNIKVSPQNSNFNSEMLEEQINTMAISLNKIEYDCERNKMIVDNKIDDLIERINRIRDNRSKSVSKSQINDSVSVKSSRSKSKSQVNYNQQLRVKISEQKKLKENQLKEALRKKKQQQKLKAKK